MQFGRGLDTTLGKRFVGMYVNADTLEQGKEVQAGLKKLYELTTAQIHPEEPSPHVHLIRRGAPLAVDPKAKSPG